MQLRVNNGAAIVSAFGTPSIASRGSVQRFIAENTSALSSAPFPKQLQKVDAKNTALAQHRAHGARRGGVRASDISEGKAGDGRTDQTSVGGRVWTGGALVPPSLRQGFHSDKDRP